MDLTVVDQTSGKTMRTGTPRFIASDKIIWVRADGTEVVVTVNIGEPYQVDADAWACPVSLDGLDGRYGDILGGSSLQALCLAINLVERRLGDMRNDQETLLYTDRSPFNVRLFAAIFGGPRPVS